MESSVYISKQFEFVEKILRQRKRKRIRNSLFLALFLHFFAFVLFSLTLNLNSKQQSVIVKETYVHFADYKPLEKLEDNKPSDTPIPEKVEENKINEEIKVKDKHREKEQMPLFKKPNTFSWREEVSKKYIKEEAKIIRHRPLHLPDKSIKGSPAPSITPEISGYLRGLIFTIKSHWQIPEDIYNKLQGYSLEVELYADSQGNIRYSIAKSSGNKIFDELCEESLKKTFSNMPFPKEFIDYLKNSDKIVFEFKL